MFEVKTMKCDADYWSECIYVNTKKHECTLNDDERFDRCPRKIKKVVLG